MMPTGAYVEEVIHLRELGNLSDSDVARATGAERSTVGSWLRRERRPSGERARRIAELSAIVERLSRVISPDYIPVWLNKPFAELDDEKPLDVIGRGEYRRVAKIIGQLEIGAFS